MCVFARLQTTRKGNGPAYSCKVVFSWKWILESRIVRSKLSEFMDWTVLYSCSKTLLCSPFSRPVWTWEPCTISPPRFVTRCCKRPLNHGTTGVQNVRTLTPLTTGYADVILSLFMVVKSNKNALVPVLISSKPVFHRRGIPDPGPSARH